MFDNYNNLDDENIEIINIKDLSNRSKNCLNRCGIFNLAQLKNYLSNNDISKIHNIGQKSIDEILYVVNYSNKFGNNELIKTSAVLNFSDDNLNNENFLNSEIKDLFNERKFKLFLEYSEKNNLVYVRDLITFDFNTLLEYPKMGQTKVDQIINRFNELSGEKNINIVEENYMTKININETINNVDIYALNLLGLKNNAINVLTKSGYNKLKDFNDLTVSQLINIVGNRYKENILSVIKYFDYTIKDLLKVLFQNLSEEESYKVAVKKACGYTLQEIGDEIGVTRERVRQIIFKFNNKIASYIYALCDEYINLKGYVTISDLTEIYDDDNYSKVIIAVCHENKNLEYLDFADLFVPIRKDNITTKQIISKLVSEYIGNGINLYDNLEEMESYMGNNGFPYMGFSEVINLAQEEGYRLYGEYILMGKQSYGFLCSKIIAKHFPNGAKLYDSDNGDVDKIKNLLRMEYGDIAIPENKRSFSSRLTEYLVLRGRGEFIAEENVYIELDLIEEIKDYIDNFNNNNLYYREIFSKFEEKLKSSSNIDNHHYLHGVLMLYYPEEYTYTRDYLIKKSESANRITLSQRILQIIIEKGRPLSKNEIKSELYGLSDTILFNAVNSNSQLFQWEYNYYACGEILKLNDEDVIYLENSLSDIINDNYGYSSDGILYEKVKYQLSDFFKANNITSSMNLFYLCEYLFKDKYDFRRPHIIKKGIVDTVDTKSISMYLLKTIRGNIEKIYYSNFFEIVDKFKWASCTAYAVFNDIEQDYLRISDDCYILESCCNINSDIIEKIENVLINQMTEDVFIFNKFECWEQLPYIGYEWNLFLLYSIIKRYGIKLRIVDKFSNDRRYICGVAVKKESNIYTYSDIVIHILKANNTFMINESKMLNLLIKNGLTYKIIPKELYNSEDIVFNGEMFVIK